MTDVQIGLERLMAEPPGWMRGKRIGLLANAASLDRNLVHARTLFHRRFGEAFRALYAPQHGFFGEKQDNMIESPHMTDPELKIPIFSLYGETRIPTPEMLDPIDLLFVDLQDAGTRVYTFIYTLSYCMETAARCGKTVAVLDRPNPVGGAAVEGNLLTPDCASFVGRFPIPMRHGLTIGELARLFNEAFGIGCDLRVIPMSGWRREMMFPDTERVWTPPSPNLPIPESALVYPGQVIWEGTNVSEGRGTTRPFECFGAPFMDIRRLLAFLGGERFMSGAVLRPVIFEPVAGKWAGESCCGFHLHVTEPRRYRPYETSLRLLQAVLACHGEDIEWKAPPYEYEFERLPIDLIIGDREVRERVASLENPEAIAASWARPLSEFAERTAKYRLYD